MFRMYLIDQDVVTIQRSDAIWGTYSGKELCIQNYALHGNSKRHRLTEPFTATDNTKSASHSVMQNIILGSEHTGLVWVFGIWGES